MEQIGITRPKSGIYIWLRASHLTALGLRPNDASYANPETYDHFTIKWSDHYRTLTLEKTGDGPSVIKSHSKGRGWTPGQRWPYRICLTGPMLLKKYSHQHGMALCDWSADGDDISIRLPEAHTLPPPNQVIPRRNWGNGYKPKPKAAMHVDATVVASAPVEPEDDGRRLHAAVETIDAILNKGHWGIQYPTKEHGWRDVHADWFKRVRLTEKTIVVRYPPKKAHSHDPN